MHLELRRQQPLVKHLADIPLKQDTYKIYY